MKKSYDILFNVVFYVLACIGVLLIGLLIYFLILSIQPRVETPFQGQVIVANDSIFISDMYAQNEELFIAVTNNDSRQLFGVLITFFVNDTSFSKTLLFQVPLTYKTGTHVRLKKVLSEDVLTFDLITLTPLYNYTVAEQLLSTVETTIESQNVEVLEDLSGSTITSGGGGGKTTNNGGGTTISPPPVTLPEGTLLFVATDGNDNNDGTESMPLKTLDAARNKVRQIKQNGLTDNIYVIVRGGTYYREMSFELTVEDSGTTEHKITYMAYPDEEVIISGANIVQPTWTPYNSNIYVADLSGQEMFYSLYVNGERATRARTANGGYDEMARFEKQGWEFRYTEYFDYNLTKNNVSQVVPQILPSEDVETITIVGFKQPRFLIDHIDGYRVYIKGENVPGFNDREDYGRFYLENSFSFLDTPGEWYFNNNTKKLYYYPLPGEDIQTSEFIIPQVQTLVSIHGDVPNLHLDSGFTISSWIKFDDSAFSVTSTPVIMDSSLYKPDGFRMELRSPGKPFFRISNQSSYDDNSYATLFCDQSPDLSDNVWHHIVGVFDFVNKKMYCYVDGFLYLNRSLPHDFSGMGSNTPSIGGSYAFFKGAIDESLVVNRSLTPQEVFQLYQSNNKVSFIENIVFDLNYDTGFFDKSGETAGLQSSSIYASGSEIRYNNASIGIGRFGQAGYYDGSWDATRPSYIGRRVHDIVFSGFTFEYADWKMFPSGRYIWDASFHVNDTGAFVMNKSYNITIKDSEIRKVGNAAILGYDSEYLSILHNHVHTVDASGILVEGRSVISEDIYSHHTISDNTIHDVGLRDNMATGIFVRYAGHTEVSHNLVYNVSYIGIRVYTDLHSFYNLNGYNNISYNEVHDTNVYLNDGGAIYLNGLQPGSVVHHNIVHDLYPTLHHYKGHYNGFYGIYLDEGASEITVYDNLVYRTFHASVFLHIPNNNYIYNNILVDAGSPLFSHYIRRQVAYKDGSTYVWAINNSFQRNVVYSSDVSVPVVVIGFTSNCTLGNITQETSRFMYNDYNLYSHDNFLFDLDHPGFSNCRGTSFNSDPVTLNLATFKTKFLVEEHSQIGNPLFVDYVHDDFRLQPGSPAYSLGFENFDLSTVGPRIS